MRIKNKIIEVTPFVCLFVYLLIGFIWQIWSPTWLIFFLIILVPMVLKSHIVQLIYPIICVAAYIAVGCIWQIWHPTWLIFLTIPIFNILFEPKKRCKIDEKKLVEDPDVIEVVEE